MKNIALFNRMSVAVVTVDINNKAEEIKNSFTIIILFLLIPIMENGKVTGIVSTLDLLKYMEKNSE